MRKHGARDGWRRSANQRCVTGHQPHEAVLVRSVAHAGGASVGKGDHDVLGVC